jgi:hypothetical protein
MGLLQASILERNMNMSDDLRVPLRYDGQSQPWPRLKPVFTVLAFSLALLAAAAEFAYQYRYSWTPLQRIYLSAYLQTAHLVETRNRYLRPPRPYRVLVVVTPHGTRLATNGDVAPAPSGTVRPRLVLSNEAVQGGAERLTWEHLYFDDAALHAWLCQAIYGGRSLWQLCRNAWYTSLVFLAVMLPFAMQKDASAQRKRRLGRVLKGANLLTRTHFHRKARHHKGVGWRTEGAPSTWERLSLPKAERTVVRVARQNECQHFLLVGDTGTGKSSLIRQLLLQIQERKEAAIVYDPAREYLPQFYNEARGDVILNPLDARMPYWGPADELADPTEADALAKSLFPDRDHENRFFIESPRKILAHLLRLHPTPRELCHWIANADPEIDRRVKGTPLEAIIDRHAPQQRSGVLGVLERASNAFRLLPMPEGRKRWTATDWVRRRAGWVFFSSTPETRETLRPLISLWLDFVILRLTAQTENAPAPVWVIVDEVASLEVLPNLPLALAESRKSNTRIVLGLQGRSQVEMRYGREAEAMLSQPRTKVFLRTSEPRGAEWISMCIGEVEMEHLREGRTSGDWGFYYSKNASLDSRIEAAILASEISNLEDLQGYFQTPGYTLKLRFPYTPALHHQPGFIPGDVEDVYLRKPGDGLGQEEQTVDGKTGDFEVIRHPELKDSAAARKSAETQGLLEMN